jgi:hypothetical protein
MSSLAFTRAAYLAAAVAVLGCARNTSEGAAGAARDTTSTASVVDSSTNQTESGVTDSSGQSTLGTGVERTRPDQGQPVTSKGDTINSGIDSTTTADSSTTSH